MAKVLIVDDSLVERLATKTILKKAGHEVFEADSGKTGVAVAKECLPDVIIMDFVMPGGDGFAAMKELKRDPATASIPVVMVSSKGQESVKFRATRLGARAYFTKPVPAPELLKVIKGE